MAQHRVNCFVCNNTFTSRATRRIILFENEHKTQIAICHREDLHHPPTAINNETRICINCDLLLEREIQELERDPDCLKLNIQKQIRNSSCFICNGVQQLHFLNLKARVQIFIDLNIYVPKRTRLCQRHLNDEGFLLKVLYNGIQYINRPYKLKGVEINHFLQALREKAYNNTISNFDDPNNFSDEELKITTSMTKIQFEELFSYCDAVQENNIHRYVKKKDLLTFLCKLHQGLSDEFLKIIFKYSSRQAVSMAISVVRRSLMIRFVPQHIGLNAISRQQFCERHVTEFANELYNIDGNVRKAIVIVDGTYSYIEKSGNFKALRQSYSVHKGRHLIKPVLVVATNGYILDIHGPYFADGKNNDASILRNEFEKDLNNIRDWFQKDDIFIVDRGYRDVIPFLEEMEFECKMPAFIENNERQLSTQKANEARMITIQRWVVEARNGHIKSIFKFLDNIIPTAHVLHLREFYLIAGAIINKYHNLILMEGKTADLARSIKEKANTPNVVQARVEEENLSRKNAMWNLLNENHVPGFPIFDLNYLKQITFGIYQSGLAPSYIQDKLNYDGTEVFEFDENRDEQGFIRIRIYSRFRNAVKYQLWIAFINNEDNNDVEDIQEPILGYYCTCKTGARTLGCCAHIASVLWFLGYARHQQTIKYPSTALLNYVLDAAHRNECNNADIIVDVE